MTPPTPPPHPCATCGQPVIHCHERGQTAPGLQGAEEVQGPLVRQVAPAARLARILHHAATELWDVCTYTDPAEMWEEARAIASRILAACPIK